MNKRQAKKNYKNKYGVNPPRDKTKRQMIVLNHEAKRSIGALRGAVEKTRNTAETVCESIRRLNRALSKQREQEVKQGE